MTSRLLMATAIAIVGLTGCANADGYYRGQPQDPYYAQYPYSGYPYGNDDGRYFRPERNVTCDREKHVCYDQYGLSYMATKAYLGERDANHSVKIYGNQVLFFSPKKGVICDRRAETCSDNHGVNRKWTNRVFSDDSYRYSSSYQYSGDYPYSSNSRLNGGNHRWTGPNGACPPKGCTDK